MISLLLLVLWLFGSHPKSPILYMDYIIALAFFPYLLLRRVTIFMFVSFEIALVVYNVHYGTDY